LAEHRILYKGKPYVNADTMALTYF